MTEILSRRPCRWRKTGVWPCGDQVLTTLGISRKPDASAKPMWAPNRAAFFLPEASFFFPALDGFFIPFQGSPLRLLRTPLQAVHQAPDMVAVIVNAELSPDQFRNARRGPQIGPVALRERPFQKQLLQAFSLRGAQLERPSRREARPQAPGSAPPPGIPPAHYRTGMAAHAPSHFIQRVTGIQQR